MAGLLPDIPLPLGEHLDELRRRLVWPIVIFGVIFVAAFNFDAELKQVFVQPIIHAARIADAADAGSAAKAGVVVPQDGGMRMFKTLDLSESMGVSMSLALWAGLAISIPFLVQQLYMFIAVGLKARERQLAFILVPAAVLCFYGGIAFGYYVGLPYMYAWFIEWQANDPISAFELQLAAYRDTFFFYTIMFGLLFDVPWAVVVICRVGLVTPQVLAKYRRIIFFISSIVAALIAPGDFFSMVALMFPTYLLFEVGLLAAYIIGGPKQKDPADA
jgi:sec-independent protein translocase protein TatC